MFQEVDAPIMSPGVHTGISITPIVEGDKIVSYRIESRSPLSPEFRGMMDSVLRTYVPNGINALAPSGRVTTYFDGEGITEYASTSSLFSGEIRGGNFEKIAKLDLLPKG